MRLAHKTWGQEQAPPTLALHGWLDNAATFDGLAPLLDLRVVALDLPGHGHSPHRSRDGTYAMVDGVADVAETLRELGWPGCVLLGHSMGAAIASLYAGTFPAHVDCLILLEGLGPLTDLEENAPARLARAIQDEHKQSKTRVFASIDEAAARVVEAAPMSLESAKLLLQRGLKPVDGGFTWRTDPRLRGTSRMRLTEGQVHAFFRAITAPTLLITATQGFPVPPEVLAARSAQIRGLEHVQLEGRHHLHLDAPHPVADVINAFLRRHLPK